MNNRKLSISINNETSTLHTPLKKTSTPVRRKTYAGNITWSLNDVGENNNLKHFDGIDLVNEGHNKLENGRNVQELSPINGEPVNETTEDNANDYIDVYLRKITKTR